MELGRLKLGEGFVRDYLDAVGDHWLAYAPHGLVPPVALAACALGSLLERLDLPPGAVHSVQEIAAVKPVPFGQEITATADVSQPKRRGGLEFITAAISLLDSDGREAIRGKSSVLVIGQGSTPAAAKKLGEERGSTQAHSKSAGGKIAVGAKDLPAVVRTITREQLKAYAQVSGDQNPLHLDPEFAATTQFGGVIAHGMLTLAFISEVMTAAFGKAWLESGTMKVRFKGAAYPGHAVRAGGRVDKEEAVIDGRRLGCSVGVRNEEDGQELVSGTAMVIL